MVLIAMGGEDGPDTVQVDVTDQGEIVPPLFFLFRDVRFQVVFEKIAPQHVIFGFPPDLVRGVVDQISDLASEVFVFLQE